VKTNALLYHYPTYSETARTDASIIPASTHSLAEHVQKTNTLVYMKLCQKFKV
jgi:hypothetical protein